MGAREQAGKMPLNGHLSKVDQQILHTNKIQHIAQTKLVNRPSIQAGLKSNKLTCLTFQDFYDKFKKQGNNTHCYEMSDYPGVFRNGEGKIYDLRPQPQISYSYLNGYDSVNNNNGAAVTTLKKLLTKGVETQIDNLKGFIKQHHKNRPEDEALLMELEQELKQLKNGGLKE